MKRLLLVLMLLAGVCLGTAIPAEENKQAKADDDSQTVVYLGDDRPIILKVHLRIDGKSHRAAWQAMMDKLFDYLDVDGNGKLSKKEVALAAPAALLASQAGFVGGRVADMDADQDGSVTRDELRAFYRKNGLPPFQIGGSDSRSDSVRTRTAVRLWSMGGRGSSEALNAKIFERLDTDKDGKLSRKELEAAAAVLAKLDKDEDEMLTSNEILGNRQTSGDTAQALVLALDRTIMSAAGGSSRFLVLDEARVDRAMARRLLAHYAKDGKMSVETKRIGLSKLDRDEDGRLDQEELSRLREVQPDIEMIVRLGKRGKNEAFMEVVRKSKALRKVEATKDGAVVIIENARLELKGADEKKDATQVDFQAEYKRQFKLADTDNNTYVDKAEAMRSRFFVSLFAVMDRDGDGKLYEKEVTAYLDQLGKLRQAVRKGCTTLTLRDEGKGLFERMDTNNDGRLSVRELRNVAKVLLALDQDNDKKLALVEVPRGYQGKFEEGSAASGRGSGDFVVFLADGGMRQPAPQQVTEGPAWFRKMDRNRDGDVSRREWLGSAETFKEADTDGDGLISLAEAEAYDRKNRKKE